MQNNLPVSFDEVSYFKNHFRGDLIITTDVFYYFPHTNIEADKYKELGGRDLVEGIGSVGGLVISYLGILPFGYKAANLGYRTFRFGRRTLRPTINRPKIRERRLWQETQSNQELQITLDKYISAEKKKPIDIRSDDSLPKPMRFEVGEVKNLKLGLKLKFETEFDTHDFGFNPLHRKHLRNALKAADFLK
jgi:hypothetical protein